MAERIGVPCVWACHGVTLVNSRWNCLTRQTTGEPALHVSSCMIALRHCKMASAHARIQWAGLPHTFRDQLSVPVNCVINSHQQSIVPKIK